MQPSDPSTPNTFDMPTPPAPSQPIIPGPGMAAPAPQRRPMWKKVPFIGAVAAVLLVGGSAGAFYSYSKSPSVMWKQALGNTATGYDRLLSYSEKQASKNIKGGTVTGTFKVTSPQVTGDGGFDFASDGSNVTGSLNAGASGVRVSANIRALKVAGSTNPDVYFQVNGLKGLGSMLGDASSLASGLDGQWFVMDHTLLDQWTKQATSQKASVPQLKQADIDQVAKAIGTVNRQYLLTTDSSKAVLGKADKVATEKHNGRQTYRYRVTVNKNHLQAYITAMGKALDATALGARLKDSTGKTISSQLDTSDFKKSIQSANITPFDVWVDTGTRLVQTVRWHDGGNTANYVDIGLNYTGGDTYPFTFAVHAVDGGNTTGFALTATLNTKTNDVSLQGTLDETGSTPVRLSFTAKAAPSTKAVSVEAPKGAKSLLELLSGFNASTSAAAQAASAAAASNGVNLDSLTPAQSDALNALSPEQLQALLNQ